MNILFTALLQRIIIDFSIPAIILFFVLIIFTVLFGRLYCSIICPLGILQEFLALLRGKKANTPHINYGFKYILSAITFGALIGGSTILIRYIEPYTMFGSAFSITILGLVFTFTILAIVYYKNRFFCTNICPVGAILGLIAKYSINKIYIDKENCVSCGMCAKACPSGCINHKEKTVDNEICIKCFKCISICRKNSIKYGFLKEKVDFNPSRRQVLRTIGAIAFLSAGYAAGVKFTKKITNKIKSIILPPGAISADRFVNKCLNCNLCVQNCTNNIIQKADKNFEVVHIDYIKGKKHCKFNCNKCSEVCPSGAIKKIDKKEKQNTRIAMATVISEKCQKCGICSYSCPKEAIIYEDNNTAYVDKTKCIGCGLCKASCPHDAIEIFAIKEQEKI